MMEEHLKLQDHFLEYQLATYDQSSLPLTNGYHEDSEGGTLKFV